MTEIGSTATPSAQNASELPGSLARGIAWTGGAKWITQGITWAATIAAAHMLGPAAYGLLGMAGIFLNLVGVFTEFGLGTAVISLRNLDDRQVGQINSVAVLLGLFGMLSCCVLAWPLSRFFQEQSVYWIVIAMSSNFLISGFRLVPYSLLQRELKFKQLAILESTQSVILALLIVLFAWLGFGYWTLVIGAVISQLFATVSTMLLRRHVFVRPTRSGMRGVLRFSGHILIGRLAWYFYTDSDFAVAGRMFGKTALGAYSLAWQFATIPIEKVSAMVTRVTPAYFAAAQNDNATLRTILLNLTEGIAFLTLPSTVGIALVAGDFVPLLLGSEWKAAVVPLQLLCVYASYRSIVTMLSQILTVKDDARWVMWLTIATAIALPACFYIGSYWGPIGIAATWLIIYPVFTVPLYKRTFAKIEMPFRVYVAVLWPAIRGTLFMTAAVLGLRAALPESWPLSLRLGLQVIFGALAYIVTTALPQRERLRKILHLVRQPQIGTATNLT
jgi:teichuronic acid exporter